MNSKSSSGSRETSARAVEREALRHGQFTALLALPRLGYFLLGQRHRLAPPVLGGPAGLFSLPLFDASGFF